MAHTMTLLTRVRVQYGGNRTTLIQYPAESNLKHRQWSARQESPRRWLKGSKNKNRPVLTDTRKDRHSPCD